MRRFVEAHQIVAQGALFNRVRSAIKAGRLEQPCRFQSLYFDEELEMYKVGERYYDPEIGRFTEVDPVWPSLVDSISWNWYLYAGANPVNFSDPTGKFHKDANTYINCDRQDFI